MPLPPLVGRDYDEGLYDEGFYDGDLFTLTGIERFGGNPSRLSTTIRTEKVVTARLQRVDALRVEKIDPVIVEKYVTTREIVRIGP